MRLKIFLKESIIDDALSIGEPRVKHKYTEERIKRYKETLEKALAACKKQKFASDDAKEAIIADLLDKQEKWNNVEAETKPTKVAPPEEAPEEKGEEAPPGEEAPAGEEAEEKEAEDDAKREEDREKEDEKKEKEKDDKKKKNQERTEKKKETHPFYGKKNENWVTKIENKNHTYYLKGKLLTEAKEIRTNTPELKYGRISTFQTNKQLNFNTIIS